MTRHPGSGAVEQRKVAEGLKDNSFKNQASKGKCSLRVCVGSERELLTGNLMKHSPLARLRPPAVVPGDARTAFGPNPNPISGGAL
jgi:hypothetical protein